MLVFWQCLALLTALQAEDTASPSAESESIPEKYKFLQEKSAIRIVKFPMPTALRTLREKDNHRVFVSDKEMCQWLGAVVSKHKSDVLRNMPNVEVNLDVLVADFKRSLKRLLKARVRALSLGARGGVERQSLPEMNV